MVAKIKLKTYYWHFDSPQTAAPCLFNLKTLVYTFSPDYYAQKKWKEIINGTPGRDVDVSEF